MIRMDLISLVLSQAGSDQPISDSIDLSRLKQSWAKPCEEARKYKKKKAEKS